MSSWFRFISEPVSHILVFLAQNTFGAGVAIILATIAIKVILLPLTFQQLRSAKAMQAIQPEIQEIQRKHKGDKQKITEETMALYKERHVNPAAGCLPLLIQMPILYGLYGALYAMGNPHDPLYSQLFTQPFLWVHNLAQPDQLHILPVFCVIAQWVQQRMMIANRQTPVEGQQATMQKMMQFMPLMVGIFSWNITAGLPIYWAVSTLFGIGQQYFVTGWGSLTTLKPAGLKLSGFSIGNLLGAGSSAGGGNGTSARDSASRANGSTPSRSSTAAARPKRGTSGTSRAAGGRRSGKH